MQNILCEKIKLFLFFFVTTYLPSWSWCGRVYSTGGSGQGQLCWNQFCLGPCLGQGGWDVWGMLNLELELKFLSNFDVIILQARVDNTHKSCQAITRLLRLIINFVKVLFRLFKWPATHYRSLVLTKLFHAVNSDYFVILFRLINWKWLSKY